MFLIGAGEVGKLLGAKWKELDDDEKKVRRCATSECDRGSMIGGSRISSKLRRTRHERRRKSRRMRCVCLCMRSWTQLTLVSYLQGKKDKGAGSGDGEDNEEDDE